MRQCISCTMLVAALALAGCAEWPQDAERVPEADQQRVVAELLDYARSLQALGPEDFRNEQAGKDQAFGRSKSETDRLRLALVLALGPNGVRDDARALALLEPSRPARAEAAGPLRSFAQLLYALVAERQRQVREEEKRGAVLQQKLDALRSLEQSIRDREQRSRGQSK